MRFLLAAGLAASLAAQDARTVVEPTVPPVCVSLDARLTAPIAPADEAKLDTERIQAALDACAKGHAVELRAHQAATAFLSGPLQLREGVTLLIARNSTLFASRDPAVYARSPGSCGLVNDEAEQGCRPLLAADHISGAGVMGEGTIDGRGGATLLGQTTTWWQLAEQARAGGRQQVPRLLIADHADNFTLYRITLRNSANFHVVYSHGDGFTVWAVKIDTPRRGARNTDGIDPMGSTNITITRSFIRTGDDNVALKGGDALSNVTISHNHFYWGHGMSIGSETNGGVSHIRVTDLSLDGPDNGIRIKSNGSRGGLVQDVVYDDVCVHDSSNPIALDTAYTAAGTEKGTSPPTFRDITLHNVRVTGGGKITFNGYDVAHRIAATLDNVQVEGGFRYTIHHADITLGPGATNLQLQAGGDSTVNGKPSTTSPASCAAKFVLFPAP